MRYIPPTMAVLATVAVSLGAASCSLMSSGAGRQGGQASQNLPGKGGSAGYAAGASAGTHAASSGADQVTRVAALLQAGIQQARQRNWPTATTAFQDVLAIDPRNVYALYDLGVVNETTNNNSRALRYYDQALAANGTYTPAMYNKAILLESSTPRAAIALYQQIIAVNPQASAAYLRMAFVDAELGDLARAKFADQKAIAINHSLSRYPLPARKLAAHAPPLPCPAKIRTNRNLAHGPTILLGDMRLLSLREVREVDGWGWRDKDRARTCTRASAGTEVRRGTRPGVRGSPPGRHQRGRSLQTSRKENKFETTERRKQFPIP